MFCKASRHSNALFYMIKYSRELLDEKKPSNSKLQAETTFAIFTRVVFFFNATKINKRHLRNNTFFVSRVLANCNSILDFYDLVKMNLSNSDQHSLNAIQAWNPIIIDLEVFNMYNVTVTHFTTFPKYWMWRQHNLSHYLCP